MHTGLSDGDSRRNDRHHHARSASGVAGADAEQGLIYAANGRIDEAVAWLDDARTRCMRIADAYLWVQAYCRDALCGVGIKHARQEARAWVGDLETLAARTGMSEMLVRAHLHRNALGDRNAAETASLFADRIDNPAVLRGISRAAL